MTAREAWEAMNEQAQMRMLAGCIVKAAKNRGMTVDPMELAGDVYIRLADKLDADKPLVLAVMDAAEMSLQKQLRHERRDAAVVHEVMGNDGESTSAVDLLMDTTRDSIEDRTITKVNFDVFLSGLDALNTRIVNDLIAGHSAREIAASVHLSHTAVNKRLNKMRSVLTVCMG